MSVYRSKYDVSRLANSMSEGACKLEILCNDLCGISQEFERYGSFKHDMCRFSERISEFLVNDFGILLKPFEYLKHIDPDECVHKAGEKLSNAYTRLFNTLRKCRKGMHSVHDKLMGKIAVLIFEISCPDFIRKREVPSVFQRDAAKASHFRESVMNRLQDMLYYVISSMRDDFLVYEQTLSQDAKNINISPYASGFVKIASEANELLLLIGDDGKKEALIIKSKFAWMCLRELLETTDPSGHTTLPDKFRRRLVTMDRDGNQIKDSLYTLNLHIHSAGNGKYYLSPTKRTPNLVDK